MPCPRFPNSLSRPTAPSGMPGTGEITLTGQLGDVMKESARISLSLLKSRLPLSEVNFRERDIHIHVPSGAVSKDGPSAGIALFTALASLYTGVKVDPRLAMHPTVELGLTIDERIADGYYYSKTVRLLRTLLENPELLETRLDEKVEY